MLLLPGIPRKNYQNVSSEYNKIEILRIPGMFFSIQYRQAIVSLTKPQQPSRVKKIQLLDLVQVLFWKGTPRTLVLIRSPCGINWPKVPFQAPFFVKDSWFPMLHAACTAGAHYSSAHPDWGPGFNKVTGSEGTATLFYLIYFRVSFLWKLSIKVSWWDYLQISSCHPSENLHSQTFSTVHQQEMLLEKCKALF